MDKPAEELLDRIARIRIGMTGVPGELKEWLSVVFASNYSGPLAFAR